MLKLIIVAVVLLISVIYSAAKKTGRKMPVAEPRFPEEWGGGAVPDYDSVDEVDEAATHRELWSYDDNVIRKEPTVPPSDHARKKLRPEPVNTAAQRISEMSDETDTAVEFDVAQAIIYSELLKPKFND